MTVICVRGARVINCNVFIGIVVKVIDWIGKNVFWSDSKQGYIGISNYNGSLTGKITITTVENSTHVFEKPRSIAVDPVKGTFFSLLRFPQLTYLFEFANFKVTFFGLIGD